MARRFLFSTVEGSGHFHPLVPLARALRDAGHEVAFVARPSLGRRVEALGFAFFPIQADPRDDREYQELKAALRAMPVGLDTEIYAFPRLFSGVSPRLRTPEIVATGREWQADMLVREAGEYGAVIAAEVLGIPLVTVAFAAAMKGMPIFEAETAAQLEPTRATWGLEPDPGLDAIYRNPVLCFSPPSLSTQDIGEPWPPSEMPPNTHFIRPDFFDASGHERLPGWVGELPDRPTVYVTLGTEVSSEPDIYPSVMMTLIEGLRDASVNLIATIGRGNDPAVFGPQPSNVHIEQYIPQSLLLPLCDMMVMHGGSNTLLQAIDAGLPTVIVPLIADQFFNARVARRVGIAQVVEREELTPVSIRATVEEVLGNPAYRENALKMQAEMQQLPGIEHAVKLLEGLVSERRVDR